MKVERKLPKEFYNWVMNMVDPDVIGMPGSREEKAAYAVYTSFQSQLKEAKKPDFLVSTAYVIDELRSIHSDMQIRHWGSARIELNHFITLLKQQIK